MQCFLSRIGRTGTQGTLRSQRSQEHPTGREPREDFRRNFCAAANFKYQRGCRNRNSGVRSCRSCRIREQGLYPKIQDQHLPRKIFAKLPRFSSLKFSQVSPLVRSSPVASCLGSSLQGRKLSRLAPTDVGTPCAFLMGREKCGLAPELL